MGPKVTGPPVGIAAELTGTVGEAVPIAVSVEDDKGHRDSTKSTTVGTRVVSQVSWARQREVRQHARVGQAAGRARDASRPSFDKAGEYIVRVQANDESGEGGGGFQCCWTNAT